MIFIKICEEKGEKKIAFFSRGKDLFLLRVARQSCRLGNDVIRMIMKGGCGRRRLLAAVMILLSLGTSLGTHEMREDNNEFIYTYTTTQTNVYFDRWFRPMCDFVQININK